MEDKVFASLPGGRVVAVDAEIGQVRWRQPDLYSAARGLSCSSDLLIANTSTGELYGLDLTDGDILWERDVGAAIDGDVCIMNDVFVHTDETGDVQVRSTTDGTLLWRNEDYRWAMDGRPAITGNTVIVRSNVLEAFDIQTGERLWQRPFEYGGAGAQWPVVGSDSVYVAGYRNDGGHVESIDVESGDLRWERDFQRQVVWPPTLYDDRIVVSDAVSIRALSTDAGSEQWTRRIGRPAGTVGTTSGVYAFSNSLLRIFDPETGARLGSIVLPDEFAGHPIPSREHIYVPTSDGEIVTLSPGGGGLGLSLEKGVLGTVAAAGLAGIGYWYTRRQRES